MSSARCVDIYEGNPTLLRLMTEILREAGLKVERAGDSPPEEVVGDLLIIDVDSGLAQVDEVAELYDGAERRVLFCGLRPSRDEFADKPWLDRPFSPADLLARCKEMLEVAGDELEQMAGGFATEVDTVDEVADDEPSTDSFDEPVTRELDCEEPGRVEEQLGLEPGTLDQGDEQTSEVESYQLISVEWASDSSVLEAHDSERTSSSAGHLTGAVRRRRIEGSELRVTADLVPAGGARPASFNVTMPDSPAALNDATEAEDSPEELELDELEEEAGQVGSDLGSQLRGVSSLLANAWYRVGLAARTEDRAERIEAMLKAAITRGTRGVSEELQRIPPGVGFLGSLEALPVIDLLRTIRDRKLRGRLELSMPEETYVLYLDTGRLEDIDALSGPLERVLLDILHEEGALDVAQRAELLADCESQELFQPLEMRLLEEGWVDEATLRRGRARRAKVLFRSLFGTRGGTFAFLEVRNGDGQPWPVSPLHLDVDRLLLGLFREGSVDTGDSHVTSRSKLVLDPARAASIDPRILSEEEREVLDVFREGATLDAAQRRLAGHDAPQIEQIVDRLKRLELLKRSNPQIRVPEGLAERVSSGRRGASGQGDDARSTQERELEEESTASLAAHELEPPSVEVDLDDTDERRVGQEVRQAHSRDEEPPTINLKPSHMVRRGDSPRPEPPAGDPIEEAIGAIETAASEVEDDDAEQ